MEENVLDILSLLEPAFSSKYDDTWRKLRKLTISKINQQAN